MGRTSEKYEGPGAYVLTRMAAPGRTPADAAGQVVAASADVARRFRIGGMLFVFGTPAGMDAAQHIAVRFVHPAGAGARALPALALYAGVGSPHGNVFAGQLRRLADRRDIAVAVAPGTVDAVVVGGLAAARGLGLLTVALTGPDPGELGTVTDYLIRIPSADPLLVGEMHVTAFHMLWQLVQENLRQDQVP